MSFLKMYLHCLGAFIIIIGATAFILNIPKFNRLFPQQPVSDEDFKKRQKEK